MKILFRSTEPDLDKAQVFHTDVEMFVSFVSGQLYWKTLIPHLNDATNNFIIKWIGREMFEKIYAFQDPQNPTPPVSTPDQMDLVLWHLRNATAKKALQSGIHVIPFALDDASLQTAKPKDMAYANKSDRDQIATQMGVEAETSIDEAMRIMASSDDPFFAPFQYHVSRTTDFFKSADDLHTYYPIAASIRQFHNIVPFIRRVEEEVQVLLGIDLYNRVSTLPTPSALTILVNLVRRYVAAESVLAAKNSLIVAITNDGLQVFGGNTYLKQREISEILKNWETQLKDDRDKAYAKLWGYLRTHYAALGLTAAQVGIDDTTQGLSIIKRDGAVFFVND